MEKILVTGSSGFLGAYIIDAAKAKGYDVLGFDIVEPDNAKYNYVAGDITDGTCIENTFTQNKIDYVIHLAANSRATDMDFNNNVVGFCKVIEAAAKHKCKKFLYASTSGLYTNNFSEDATINISPDANPYGMTKFMNELIAQTYAKQYPNMKFIGTRAFNVYGLGEVKKADKDSRVHKFINMKLKGEPLTIYFDGKQTNDFVAAKDVGNIYIELLEKANNGVYNIGTGIATNINQLAEIIGGERKYVQAPANIVIPSKKKCADTEKLRKIIGDYRFIPLEEGVRQLTKELSKV